MLSLSCVLLCLRCLGLEGLRSDGPEVVVHGPLVPAQNSAFFEQESDHSGVATLRGRLCLDELDCDYALSRTRNISAPDAGQAQSFESTLARALIIGRARKARDALVLAQIDGQNSVGGGGCVCCRHHRASFGRQWVVDVC
jgi:hypothetical protein